MIIFPAIDIKEGKVVRLLQGDFDKVQEYGQDPVTTAQHWVALGAKFLHLVDLDGAKTGVMQNKEVLLKIARSVDVPVQTGGGIRSQKDIQDLLEGGVARVILGTKVIEDTAFLRECLQAWPEKIAVSLDCHNGMVAQRGWVETSDKKATDFVQELEKLGVRCVVYTDIARDGMLTGPNFEGLQEILNVTRIPVIASGGVATVEDIQKLKALESQGVLGAITGKAIYEGTLDLKEALKVAEGAAC